VSVELFPFSFEEFLVSKKIQWTHDSFLLPDEAARLRLAFEDYIQIGGFPEIALGGYSQRYLQELYDRLITRDITTRHKIRQVQLLKQVALHSISTLGARQTYQKTAKNLSVKGAMTVRKFVDLLEEAYLLFSVSPFSFKVKEILKLPRKIYPIDLGLWRSITLKSGQDTGAQLETFVFLQLRRSHQEIFYFLDQDCEVDFVIREGREVRQLIQVSHSLQDVSTKKREIKALVHASQKTKCKNILVLTSDESGEEKIEGLTIPIMPAWKWALGVHM
jgi:predicted AAA+ superfamily ATPase